MGFRLPEHVRGWLAPEEGRKLADLAAGKRVLEIGSFEGLSTICLARTAASVECIDPFDGRATPANGQTHYDLFLANLVAHGVRRKVTPRVGTTDEIAPHLEAGAYDLVFIDGDHRQAAVENDYRWATRLLAPGGLIAFHDYRSDADPGVTAAVDGLLAGGAELVDLVVNLAVLRPGSHREREKPVVAMGMPRRGRQCSFGASEAYHLCPTVGNRAVVVRLHTASSILDHTFNRLWCGALNLRQRGVTHFAMIHDDVCPGQGWLDLLLDELTRTGADVLSAVVPIKSAEGVTSTAVETDDPWRPRRLTMHEVYEMPPTFSDEDAGGELLLNSGLWVCDLRRPWVDTPGPLCFQTLNRIVKDDDGDWQAQVRSEDWEFSRAARARGATLYATRLVALRHEGEADFPNTEPWGEWETDEIHAARAVAKNGQPRPALVEV